jgi:glycosyltransferase involved in cell wall biosynthesis
VRIALDASYSVSAEPTGIGIYSARLISELARLNPADRLLLCYRPKQFFQSRIRQMPSGVSRRLLQPPLPVWGADVFHGLNQRIDRRPAPRVVTTFHDLFVMTSGYSSTEFRARFTRQAQLAATNSDLIVGVSEFTASQVRDLLHVPSAKIRVIPHGVDPVDPPPGDRRENIILFVGVLQERKNLIRLVKAFERVPVPWRLVLAGASNGFGAQRILDAIARSPARERIEITGYLPATALGDLYRRAAIFAFPSLDEGFGIPVLEAMASGVPVLTSNRSALPEVAGDAALLVDPVSEDQIGDALLRLAGDENLRNELRTLGYRRAADFTWQKTAQATYGIYRELVGK